ncbi:MAG TPA: methyltransferase domain-containing protein [Vicinamibacterales bacterium]|nr:methyltransferase domain-containing protein [Vicinamibacterales bacterium]
MSPGLVSSVVCAGCGRVFATHAGYLDLRPLTAFQEQTKYLDEALHADARHESIAPPLLGSKVRYDMLRRFLKPGRGDRIIDLGCGSGRTLAWTAPSGAELTGIDIAPYFAPHAVQQSDLVLGDLRRLPIRDGSFAKAWSLDVLEHLSRPALVEMLTEANRVLEERGALFVYTHVRKNGWLAGGTRMVNRFAAFCERRGWLDLNQERLRKSDHVNPLTDHDDLARVAAECGFTIERITYYTPIVGAFIENVLVRIAEKSLARRAERAKSIPRVPSGKSTPGIVSPERTPGIVSDEARKEARRAAQARVRRGGALYGALVMLSWIMKIDVLAFGRFRSGPFFALLRKTQPMPAKGRG